MEIRKILDSELAVIEKVDVAVWSDWVSRDLNQRVTVPSRPVPLLRAFLEGDRDGCFVGTENNRIIGYIFSRTYGNQGYFGPFGVLPEYQRKGYGKILVRAAVEYLEEKARDVVGLETMPQTGYNLGLYTKLGFKPRYLTLRMEKELSKAKAEPPSNVFINERANRQLLNEVSNVSSSIEKGLDYSKEVTLTEENDLGFTVYAAVHETIAGFAVCYAYPKPMGLYPVTDKQHLRIRLLAVHMDFNNKEIFDSLLSACEAYALSRKKTAVQVPVYTEYYRAYARLLEKGYRVHPRFASLVRLTRRHYQVEPNAHNLSEWAG